MSEDQGAVVKEFFFLVPVLLFDAQCAGFERQIYVLAVIPVELDQLIVQFGEVVHADAVDDRGDLFLIGDKLFTLLSDVILIKSLLLRLVCQAVRCIFIRLFFSFPVRFFSGLFAGFVGFCVLGLLKRRVRLMIPGFAVRFRLLFLMNRGNLIGIIIFRVLIIGIIVFRFILVRIVVVRFIVVRFIVIGIVLIGIVLIGIVVVGILVVEIIIGSEILFRGNLFLVFSRLIDKIVILFVIGLRLLV